jgi:undecaprenyl diphosphate synthase
MDRTPRFARLPRHVGMIPDGNRRWAKARGLPPEAGYAAGLEAGLRMLDASLAVGLQEVSVYGFTMDNTKRPKEQRLAFAAACAAFVEAAMERPVALRVVGDAASKVFPDELRPYAEERRGDGAMRVNLLVNYGWEWDLRAAACALAGGAKGGFAEHLASADVSRMDLIVRWGGTRRLSGFLPVQSVYADIFVSDGLWPDSAPQDLYDALAWHAKQDATLGG